MPTTAGSAARQCPLRPRVVLLPGLLVVAAAACLQPPPLPEDAQILCSSTAPCPAGFTCRTAIGRCVSSSNKDQSAPQLVGEPAFEPAPPLGTRGTVFSVGFAVDEDLFREPLVHAETAGGPAAFSLDPARSDPAGRRYTFTYTASGDEGDGPAAVTAELVDLLGNQASRVLGDLTLDFTPPAVLGLDWTLPAGKTAASPDDSALPFTAVTEAGVVLGSATLRDQNGNALADLAPAVHLTADGSNLRLDGSVDPSGLDLDGVTALRAEVRVRDAAGNLSLDDASRTPSLDVDGVPPQEPRLQIAPSFAPVSGQTVIGIELAASGATQMRISGDVVAASGMTFEWIPLQQNLIVTLLAGDGPKTLHAVFRDGAFNESEEVSASTELRTGAVASAPVLVLPAGQGAVKNGDTLGIAGGGEAGCSFVSGRLRVVGGVTLVALGASDVRIAADGSYSGSVTVSGAGHGEQLALELVVRARGLNSLPGNSTSDPVSVDLRAPAIEGSPVLTPAGALARRGATLGVAFVVDEALATDPLVRLEASARTISLTLDEAKTDRALRSYSFAYTVVGDEGDGPATLSTDLGDPVGNQARRALGSVTLDFTAPLVTALGWALPAGKTAARLDDSALAFTGQAEAGTTLATATLLDEAGQALADLTAGVTLTAEGDHLRLQGSADLGGLTLVDGNRVQVEALVRDAAGNLSLATASRTPLLDVDGVPPQDALVQIAPAYTPVTAQTVIALTAYASGATQLRLTGDVVAATGLTFEWIALQSPLTVTLTSGDGPKTIAAEFRDGAFNTTGPITAATRLDTGAVASAPVLVLPPGQTAAKNGDTLGIAGGGEAGCSFVSGRLRVVGGATLVSLTAASVNIAPDGSYAGSVELSGASEGQQVALELIVRARGQDSLPAASLSAAVNVDLTPPLRPDASKLVLVEQSPAPDDPAQIADSHNAVHLTGLDGAATYPATLRVYDNLALTNEVTRTSVHSTGSFDELALPVNADETYYLVAVDGAGNQSLTATLALPAFTFSSVSPPRAGTFSTVSITFTSTVPLVADPSVKVGNREATRVSGPNPYVYRFGPSQGDPEGVDQAVIRVVGQPSGLAAGSQGTTATTTTLDVTLPSAVDDLILLVQNDPGSSDQIVGLPGAVYDLMGDELVDLEQWPVNVEPWGEWQVRTPPTPVNSDGSFTLDIGDNLDPFVYLALYDGVYNRQVPVAYRDNDITAPVVELVQIDPPAQRHGGTVTVALRVEETAAPRTDLRALTVTVDGQPATLTSGDLATSDGQTHDLTYQLVVDQAQTSEGPARPVVATAWDSAGNSASASGSVLLDFSGPVVTQAVPGDRTEWKGEDTLTGAASDALSTVARVELAFRDVAADRFWSGSAFDATTAGWFAASGTTAWTYPSDAAFEDGRSYAIWIRGIDSLGNVGTPLVKDFVCNKAIPDTPTDLVVDDSEPATIALDWAPVAGADHYRVYYDLAGQGPPYLGSGAVEGDSGFEVTTSGTVLHGLATARYSLTVTAVASGAESGYALPASGACRRWQWIHDPLTSNPVHALCSPSAGHWVASGGGGTIWYSLDDGATWQVARSGTLQDLVALRCGDGYAIATGGGTSILRTTDDGVTWQRHTVGSGSSPDLYQLWIEGQRVVVAGYDASYLSDDGGQSFVAQARDPGQFFQVSDMWGSGDTLLAVGASQVLRTTDSGLSWNSVYDASQGLNAVWGSGDTVIVAGESGALAHSDNRGLSFAQGSGVPALSLRALWGSGSTMLAAGERRILRSTDGGISWTSVHSDSQQWFNALAGQGDVVLAAGTLGCCAGVVYRSTDLGASWTQVYVDTSHSFATVALDSSDRALAAGAGAAFVRSADGGASWESVHGEDTCFANRAVWSDGQTSVVAGQGDSILRTSTAGQSWSTVVDSYALPVDIFSVQGRGGRLVAIGDQGLAWSADLGASWSKGSGVSMYPSMKALWLGPQHAVAVAGTGRVWSSADDGASWSWQQLVSTGEPLLAVAGDEAVAVAVGVNGHAGRSADGGATWTAVETAAGCDLGKLWVAGQTAVAVPSVAYGGRIARSVDGGATWGFPVLDLSQYPDAPAIAGSGVDVVIVSSSDIFHSGDAGATWAKVGEFWGHALSDVWASGGTFYAVGTRGALLRSTDGGVTWNELAAEAFDAAGVATDLLAVWGSDAGNVFALGALGTLLQYGPP